MLIISGEVAYKKAVACNWTTELNNQGVFYRRYSVNGRKTKRRKRNSSLKKRIKDCDKRKRWILYRTVIGRGYRV